MRAKTTLSVGGLLLAAVLALGSGCATHSDWIERTLVTVDVTGVWQGTSAGTGGRTPLDRAVMSLDLRQEGSKVRGVGQASGGGIAWGRLRTGASIEGTIGGDVFSFGDKEGAVKGELIVSGDEMNGNVNGMPFTLRRVDSSSRPGRQDR